MRLTKSDLFHLVALFVVIVIIALMGYADHVYSEKPFSIVEQDVFSLMVSGEDGQVAVYDLNNPIFPVKEISSGTYVHSAPSFAPNCEAAGWVSLVGKSYTGASYYQFEFVPLVDGVTDGSVLGYANVMKSGAQVGWKPRPFNRLGYDMSLSFFPGQIPEGITPTSAATEGGEGSFALLLGNQVLVFVPQLGRVQLVTPAFEASGIALCESHVRTIANYPF